MSDENDVLPFGGIDATLEPDAVENTVDGALNYAFIGVGGAGGRIAQQFYKLGYSKTLAINTAEQDLAPLELPEDQKLKLEMGISGAGKDMARGEQAFDQRRAQVLELIKRVCGETTDHIMICVGAGGGTGGGSMVPVIMTAKDYLRYLGLEDLERRVGVIMTLPSNSEAAAGRTASNAAMLSDKLSTMAEDPEPKISPLLVIDNERVNRMYRGLTARKFWPTINHGIASLFHTFNTIVKQPSEQWAFDDADYRSVIATGGHCIMGVTNIREVSGDLIQKAIFDNLSRTMLAEGFDMTTAKSGAGIIVGSEKMFDEVEGLMDAADKGFAMLSSMTKSNVHRGMYTDEHDILRIYTILGGLTRPADRYRKLRNMAGGSYPKAE